MSTSRHDHAWFQVVFAELAPRVFGYARRQCDETTAQDIVADTFLVAWRRREDVPEPALPWLLVVARNTIANRRRHERRQDRLADTLAYLDRIAAPAASPDHDVVERETVLRALGELSDLEREALLLVAWDGLTNRDASVVVGCSTRAFEVRLSRARARLARGMAEPDEHGAASRPPSDDISLDALLDTPTTRRS